jgi:hypothetical protein
MDRALSARPPFSHSMVLIVLVSGELSVLQARFGGLSLFFLIIVSQWAESPPRATDFFMSKMKGKATKVKIPKSQKTSR